MIWDITFFSFTMMLIVGWSVRWMRKVWQYERSNKKNAKGLFGYATNRELISFEKYPARTNLKEVSPLKNLLSSFEVNPKSSLVNSLGYNPTELAVSYHAQNTFRPAFSSVLALYQAQMKDETRFQDDLTTIKGITQELAFQLNRIGIYTFEDIAAWSSLDIRRVSVALELQNQILEQNWVVQAQNLCYQPVWK